MTYDPADPFGKRYAATFLVSSLDNPIGELSLRISGAVAEAHKELGDTAWVERISAETTMFGQHYRIIFKPTDRPHHPLELEQVVWEMAKGHN